MELSKFAESAWVAVAINVAMIVTYHEYLRMDYPRCYFGRRMLLRLGEMRHYAVGPSANYPLATAFSITPQYQGLA